MRSSVLAIGGAHATTKRNVKGIAFIFVQGSRNGGKNLLSKEKLFLAALLRGEAYSNLEAQEHCNFLTYASQAAGDLRRDDGWPTFSKKITPSHPARRYGMDFDRLAEMCGTDVGTMRQVASSLADRVTDFGCAADFVTAAKKIIAPRVPKQVDLFQSIARGSVEPGESLTATQ